MVVVQLDHSFLDSLVFLSMYCVDRKMGVATLCPTKGVHSFVTDWCVKRLDDMQMGDIRLRTDQDSSVRALAQKIKEGRRYNQTLCEESALASHQSLGGAERFHRLIQEQCRVMRTTLEENLHLKIAATEGFGSWLVRHASWTLFRFHAPRDTGRTAFTAVRGHPYTGEVVVFGEAVMARRAQDATAGRRTSRWSNRWTSAVWLGKTQRSDEHIVFNGVNIEQCRVVRR
jgi:hypothetical protein